MIIIVEGPDGAGKSTLIESLLKSHPGSVSKHFGHPKSSEEALNYWRIYAQAIEDAPVDSLTIFDRSWYSDVVYGPIFRDTVEMDALHVKMLEALVMTRGGGYVIYCTAPIRTLWSRCKKRGEEYVPSEDKLIEVSRAYNAVMAKQCGLPVVRYDTSY